MNMASPVTALFLLSAAMPFGISHAETCEELSQQYQQKATQYNTEQSRTQEAYSRCMENSDLSSPESVNNCANERAPAAGEAESIAMKQELMLIETAMRLKNCPPGDLHYNVVDCRKFVSETL